MMDPSNPSPADGLEVVHQNGVHEEPSYAEKYSVVLNDVDPSVAEITETLSPNGNVENAVQLDGVTASDSSLREIIEESNDNVESNNVTISKEGEVKITDQREQSTAPKALVKNKNVKPHGPKGAPANIVKKNKDGRDEEALSRVPNGNLGLNSCSRQPAKGRLMNERQTQLSKLSGKSDAAASEASIEKTKPKSLKKGNLEVAGEEQSSISATAEDAKLRRVGTLPNYGFNFKCNERAERRKEFYSKLEQKIHAKEVEQSNLQAKTKETQEAEIKMLRKSLTFKATPMPSFYQEPPPPKVELKKIPTTRPKSPKLGRRKSSTNAESEGNNGNTGQQVRLSLDEKASQNNHNRGAVNQKKPLRRSLPSRLPSNRPSSTNPKTAAISSKTMNNEKTSFSSVTNQDTVSSNVTEEKRTGTAAAKEENNNPSSMTSEASLHIREQEVVPRDGRPSGVEPQDVNGDLVVEEQLELTPVQEPKAAEY